MRSLCLCNMKALLLVAFAGMVMGDQTKIDYLSSHLEVVYDVIDNNSNDVNFTSKVTFTNKGDQDVFSFDFEIHFDFIRMIEPKTIRPNGTLFGQSGLMVHHVNGVHFKLTPTENFRGFLASESVVAEFVAEAWIVAYTDVMPTWYIVAENTTPKLLLSTVGEELSFITPFTSEKQWKRNTLDQYDPYTPEVRLEIQKSKNLGHAPLPFIPTPVLMELDDDIDAVKITKEDWVIWRKSNEVTEFHAEFLSEKLGGLTVEEDRPEGKNTIELDVNVGKNTSRDALRDGEYRILIKEGSIALSGQTVSGVFYGIQSLVSMYQGSGDGTVPACYLRDYPRYQYRGQHVDISRNFFDAKQLKKIIDVMAMYKLNKFHLHLTDDEGWRLEIPSLPELTTVGAKRCHKTSVDTALECLIPQLGSGPDASTSGSGYLSVDEYKDLLIYANQRHIEVIPEFDVPGHAHAAVNAMLARYYKYKDTDPQKATEYLLTDLDDESEYLSVQYFTDNAINPCLASTYAFMGKVMDEIIEMHQDIQPLRGFHFGGDEQPKGAWTKSPACQGRDPADLKAEFVSQLSDLANDKGLEGLYGWEDGLMTNGKPLNKSSIATDKTVAYFWDNIWEWGRGGYAYTMANAGYQVVLSHATHLYFDHPYEPDPEERGYYWATRIIPTAKTHSFIPDDIYKNIRVDRNGNEIDRDGICEKFECDDLDEDARDNIIGIQGQLWSETVRTEEQLNSMIFPRLLALAERAWHKADWESIEDKEKREAAFHEDWIAFSNTLGYRELRRLDDAGILYRVPPPAANITSDRELVATTEYPGLPIEYSLDKDRWEAHEEGVHIPSGVQTVFLRASSADGSRYGRIVHLDNDDQANGTNRLSAVGVLFATFLIGLLLIIFP